MNYSVRRKSLLGMIIMLLISVHCWGQVSVGSGSYATTFPGTDVAGRNTYPSGGPTLSGTAATKPVPTNDWWSNMIKANHGGQAFNYPLSYKSMTSGLTINYTVPPAAGPTEYRQPMGDVNGIVMGVDGLNVTQSTASNHSDWTVTMTWSGGGKTFNATMGQGMPFTYFTKGSSDLAKVVINHNPGGATVSGNKIIVTNNYNNASFVIFGPAGTVWNGSGGVYTSTLNGKNYWSMAMLPIGSNVTTAIAALEPHAFVFPGNTQVSWNYTPSTGIVRTTFTVTPDVKEGASSTFVQGLLPHQWSRLAASSPQPSGLVYSTVRGQLKMLASNTFIVDNRFSGILPTLPNLGKYSSGFDPGALYRKIDLMKNDGLAEWTDSYNEGQAMNRLIQAAHLADQIGHTQARDLLLNTVKARLQDWFTAEGGEVAFLFYYNNTWKTMIGYPAGHRQDENLNDHHFHWGYFIHAAAAIEQYQPGWAAQWGGMVDLLIRDAASPSRTDSMFPFLRNFSPFAGHCWANGFATEPFGNDQESTSESMQFNSSLIHWGTVTGNTAIRDLGIYLYTTEQSAVEEYWFDQNNRTFQPEYVHEMVARIWGGGYDNGTWWTQDIAASYGIQLYPIHGGALYMGHNTAYIQEVWNGMTSKTQVLSNVSNDNLWYDTYWSFLSFLDPAQAISLYNAYPNRNIKFGISDAQTYHWLHTMNAMGQVMEEITANHPIAAVFNKNGTKTYVAHNYGATAITVNFSDGYSLSVPARKMATSRDIVPTATITSSASQVPNGGSVTLNATTSGSGIIRVEFYRNTTLVGSDNTAPYSITASNLPLGLPNFYARVVVGSNYNISNVVTVQVGSQLPYNGSPSAIPGTIEAGHYDLFEGGSGQGVSYSDATTWNEGNFRPAEAVDAGTTTNEGVVVGWIDAGEWLEYTVNVAQSGTYSLAVRYTSGNASGGGPFWFENATGTKITPDQTVAMNDASWTNYLTKTITGISLTAGQQVIRFKAGNGGFNLGRMTFTFTGGNSNPTVSLTSPANGATFNAPVSITLNATASDSDGTISQVAFYNGTTLLGTDSSNPYSYTWTNVAAGTYSLTARATDNGGATATSQAASITVSTVTPVLTTITVSPSTTSIAQNGTRQFTAQGLDQNGNPMTITPTWSATGGTVNSSGLFTGTTVGTFTVTASASGKSGSASITVTGGGSGCSFNAATGYYTANVSSATSNPTITFVPASTGIGATTCILYYGTSATGNLPGYLTSPNTPYQINASAAQTIYFYYTHSLPQGGESNTSGSRHSFVVGNCGSTTPVLTTITVSPTTNSIAQNATRQFTAQGLDQNGNPMTITPTWSASGGTINSSGLYTGTTVGSFTVTASASGKSGSAPITVTGGGSSCSFNASTGYYTANVSSASSNPTITFVPSSSGIGSTTCILYYGTSATGNLPGYTTSPNTPFQINAAAGQTIYFYYTHSLPQGGESNTSGTRHSFVVGNCGSSSPVLTTITVSPASSTISQSSTRQFSAQGFDQNGNAMTITPTWSASGGTINSSGLYTGTSIGSFTVTASASGKSGTASISVNSPGCTFTASTGHYTANVSSAGSNPTITFVPTTSGVGSTTCILYYGTSATGGLPGYFATPNTPFQITASAGQTIYFYYTYSLPQGGESNTSNSRHSFVVGNCSGQRLSVPSTLRAEMGWSIYPNPVKSRLTIQGVRDSESFRIVDVSGKEWMKITLTEQENSLAVNELPAGIYLILSDDRRQQLKFIKE